MVMDDDEDDDDGQMMFGDLVGLKLPDICLTGEEKPHPGNLSRPGTQARCVTSTHATTYPTAVDNIRCCLLRGTISRSCVLPLDSDNITL